MKDSSKSQVRHYSEIEGIKSLLDEMLEEATEIMIIGSVEEEVRYFQKYFPRYIELRIKKRIPARIIAEDNETTRKFAARDIKDLRNIKFMNSPEKIPSIMYLWSNRLIIISFGSKVNITSVEDKNIYQLMKRNFEFLWESL